MPEFSEQILQRISDPAVQEETRRSMQQRGVLGHYVAGAYRTFARPIAQWQIIQRARFIYFMWGMDGVANLIETLPSRYTNDVLRHFGATVGDDVIVGDGLRFATVHGIGLGRLSMGHQVFFGRRCFIDMSHEVSFGDCCLLGNDTAYISHTDFAHSPLKKEISPVKRGPVRIGRGACVASGTVIPHSVTIGECALVGANSFVNKHVPPYTFVAGNPAKVIARIDRSKVPPFDPAKSLVIPEGSTPEDFPYDDPQSLKIPDNVGVMG